jgi:hypothetical protein
VNVGGYSIEHEERELLPSKKRTCSVSQDLEERNRSLLCTSYEPTFLSSPHNDHRTSSHFTGPPILFSLHDDDDQSYSNSPRLIGLLPPPVVFSSTGRGGTRCRLTVCHGGEPQQQRRQRKDKAGVGAGRRVREDQETIIANMLSKEV